MSDLDTWTIQFLFGVVAVRSSNAMLFAVHIVQRQIMLKLQQLNKRLAADVLKGELIVHRSSIRARS
jgi:hypothetical protein